VTAKAGRLTQEIPSHRESHVQIEKDQFWRSLVVLGEFERFTSVRRGLDGVPFDSEKFTQRFTPLTIIVDTRTIVPT